MSSASPRLIAIGGSAGSLKPLKTLLGALPEDLPACVLICIHRHIRSNSFLTDALRGSGPLPVDQATDRVELSPGRIFVAPPDVHMVVAGTCLRLSRGPRENSSRPAIDVLFRSVAASAGPNAIGVVLSGMLSDGAAGARALERCGAPVLVQHPDEAEFPEMPSAAMRAATASVSLPVKEIVDRLAAWSRQPYAEPVPIPDDIRVEVSMALGRSLEMPVEDDLGTRSRVTCPDCHGILWELTDQEPLRFRCHTGHAFTAESLEAEQSLAVERSMWIAMRSLREQAETLRRLSARSTRPAQRTRWEEKAVECDNAAAAISAGLTSLRGGST